MVKPHCFCDFVLERRCRNQDPARMPLYSILHIRGSFEISISEAGLWVRVSASSHLIGCLGALFGGLLCLLLRSQGIDLLAGLEKAAVVLLLEFGADVVQGHQSRCALEVVVKLALYIDRSASAPGQ